MPHSEIQIYKKVYKILELCCSTSRYCPKTQYGDCGIEEYNLVAKLVATEPRLGVMCNDIAQQWRHESYYRHSPPTNLTAREEAKGKHT
jgi:hypothetical protein